MAEQLILPRRVLDANGNPLSGAKLYAYIEGTTTLETVYSDEALSSTHPSPLLSDAGGNFPPIWHGGDHGVKIAIADSSDVELSWSPLDPCPATSSATNATNISFTPTANNPATNVQDAIVNATTTGSDVSERSVSFTATANDIGTVVRCTAALTIDLTSAPTLTNGFIMTVIADGGDVTIDPNGVETIDGAATIVIQEGKTVVIHCTGTAFFTSGFGNYIKEYHDASNLMSWRLDGKKFECWGRVVTSGSGTATVTFPTAPDPVFVRAPTVVMSPLKSSGVIYGSLTSVGALTAGVFTSDGGGAIAATVHWYAIGEA
jgi:hypothetical protein